MSNSLSDKVARRLGLNEDSMVIGFDEIDGQLVGYIWGKLARNTLRAAKIFISPYLGLFINEIATTRIWD